MEQIHTVLGASGAMGFAVTQILRERGLKVRLVSRSGKAYGESVMQADLLDRPSTIQAIEGSSHVYVCTAFDYSAKVWQRDWPRHMAHLIEACASSGARLIFLDNMYMYGPAPLPVPFAENTPQHPPSEKGKVRKAVADMLMEAFASGKVRGVICRSADFFGPHTQASAFYNSVLDRMMAGKAPQSLVRPGVRHTYSFTLDNARAMVTLALDEESYGQVWHLPVGEGLTPEEIVARLNQELGTTFKLSFVPGWMQSLLSLFIPIIREVREMKYQFDSEYRMDWSKFRNRYPDFRVTPYAEAIREMVQSFRPGK